MKKIKKSLTLALAGVLTSASFVGALAGCGGGGGGGNNSAPSENEVTYVRLLHYDAGYGRTYLEKTKKLFEEAVKDVEYEPGKKGVYIDIDNSLVSSTSEHVLSTLENSDKDIFFPNLVDPLAIENNGHVMEISHLLNADRSDEGWEKISPFVDEVSIKDRMFDEMADYFTSKKDGESMYATPGFMLSTHLYYDVDLVESRGLYIADGSTDTDITLTDDITDRQKGPDGRAGTTDDGMPETYAQFYLWMAAMEDQGITPLHFAGKIPYHLDLALAQFWADYEGATNVKACYTFDGTVMTNLVDEIDANGNVTYRQPTAITFQNGYEVQAQESRYRVMQLAKKISDTIGTPTSWVHPYATTPSETHTSAQTTYLTSTITSEPIMLFAEGSYWEAEAKATFDEMSGYGKGKMDRKIAVFPVPKYSRDQIDPDNRTTVFAQVSTDIFINKAVETRSNKQAVIDFFMFYNMAQNMDMQQNEASSIRPYDYELDATVQSEMSYLAKDYYRLMNDENTDVVFGHANNNFVRANIDNFDRYFWVFYSQFNDHDSASYACVDTFRNHNDPTEAINSYVTAESYFKGFEYLYTNRASGKSEWQLMLERAGM